MALFGGPRRAGTARARATDRSEAAGLRAGGRSERHVVGLIGVAVVALTLLTLGDRTAPWPWALLALAALLFAGSSREPLRGAADRIGSTVVVVLLTAFLIATGGGDSIFQDLYVLVLLFSATTSSWGRWSLDAVLVVAGNVLVGIVDAGGTTFWQDLAFDLAVWVLVSVVAGMVTRRLARASATSRRLRSAVDLLEDAVVVVDADDLVVQYANRAARQLAGGGQVVGLHPHEVGPWPDGEALRAARRDGSTISEVRIDDGRVLEVRLEPVERASGPVVMLFAHDVTARHEDQRRLAQREQRFRALAEQAAGIVYRVRIDPDGGDLEAEFVGPQLHRILGLAPDELRADPGLIVRRARDSDRPLINLLGDQHVYGEVGTHTYRVRHAGGHWVWLEDHHTPEFDDEGHLVAVQGIAFDVSARRAEQEARAEAQRSREIATETMRRTAQIERTFLQSLSHELRTPMHAILGFVRTLQARLGLLSAHEQGVLLERLLFNAVRLEELVQTLLEFDRSARGEGDLDRRLVRVDELVGQVAEVSPLRGRRLHTHLEPVDALVDRPQLERSVERLLGNAVRHTPPDATIELRVVPVDGRVRIEVADDGPGVAPELAETIFEPFRQGPEVERDASPGLGLGLSMVRMCARMHGGDAYIEPVEPHGVRFIVELPRVGADHASDEVV